MSRPYRQGERARTAARTGAAIDAAAIREVTRRGYAAVRVADIAARAGVSPRTLYLRAPSKERLIEGALRARAAALILRVERWRPRATAAEAVIGELVALHERTYRTEKALLEALVEGGLPPSAAGVLRELDDMRLAIIERTMIALARRRALRLRAADATAL
ncbi:MAG: helix-turn-helix domain-containing protein, partial [Candidatus Limnocylindria bacterium]|nr:helix-turn-helix domain-containing protein [Candidatus Limnocylindria bacterium]